MATARRRYRAAPALEPPDGGAAGPSATETKSPSPAPRFPRACGNGNRRYSPVVQRIAAEHDIDLSQVPGTGRGGRVRKQDVLALVEGSPVAEPPMHIESPYRPDPVPPPARGRRRRRLAAPVPGTVASCRGCGGRSAST